MELKYNNEWAIKAKDFEIFSDQSPYGGCDCAKQIGSED